MNQKSSVVQVMHSVQLGLMSDTTDPDKADPAVGGIVLQFSKIDTGCYSYRYPVDRKGKPIPIAHNDLHLPTLKDVINGVAGYFSGTDGYLRNHIAAHT